MNRMLSTKINSGLALLLGIGVCTTSAIAGTTDLADAPLSNSGAALVKPNLMFILDDSGSMNRDHMPDWVDDDNICKDRDSTHIDCDYSDPPYNSPLVNGIYYNPDITYTPAVNYDGTSRTSYTTWTAVPNDAYGIQFTGTIDLTSAYPDTVWCDTSSTSTADVTAPFSSGRCKRPIQAGVWTYPNSTFSNRKSVAGTRNPYYYKISSVAWCSTRDGTTGFGNGTCQAKKTTTYQYAKYGTGSNGFTRVDIVPATANYPRASTRTDCSGAVGSTGCTYAEEMTNFANWYAYYRTRMQMMKTASGLGFKQVTDNFRVGFITINPGSPVAASKYLPMADFAAGAGNQKNNWYTKFYAQAPAGFTPLRAALSRVGRYYANITTGINAGITDDPVQYSCQQNFTLLSTDGFWNGNAGQKVDGSAVGHQDSDPVVAPRPMLDGPLRTTVVTSSDTLTQAVCVSNAAVFGTTCGCSGADLGKSRVKQQTASSATTVVSIDGVVQSTTPSSSTTYQNITGCMAEVTTEDTPSTIVDEQTVTGNAATTFAAINGITAGSNTNGTCAANFAQVVTRTTSANSRVVTTGTVVAAPVLSATYAFGYGACAPLTATVVTRFSVVQEQTLTANGASSFGSITGTSGGPSIGATGGTQATGACSANQARIWRRTSTYDQTATTIGSGATTYTFTAPSYGVPVAVGAGCSNLTTVTSVTETAQNVCSGSANTTYAAAGNGSNSQIGCGCTGGNTALRQRVWNYRRTQVGTGAPTYSNGTPVLPTHSVVTACSTAAKSVLIAPNPTVSSSVVSVTGTPVAAATSNSTSVLSNTSSGAPAAGPSSTTPGTVTSTTTGANASSSDFTISPNPTTTTSTTSSSVAVGYADTLADVAQYYYHTDLRAPGSLGAAVGTPPTQLDVGTANNVRAQSNTDVQNDIANWQHMTTFTLGLGVDGTLTYNKDYRTAPTGDFLAIKNGTLNWPQPVADSPTTTDDLWHAAVNGRGVYFSARDPDQLSAGLSTALTSITSRDGAASAAATSNLEPIEGDNFAYIASYRTQFWDGDLDARTIDPLTGAVSVTSTWSAQAQLDTLAAATTPGGNSRNIFFRDPATGSLASFTWANLSPALQANFSSAAISSLPQWPGIVSLGQQAIAEGQNLVNFLRGDSTYESQYYRVRDHVLGDIVNGAPVFVKSAQANFVDPGYSAPAGANFKECVKSGGAGCGAIFNGPRSPTVYVAANDGMLHAFNATNGVERWAYIPGLMMPRLYRLADRNYKDNHEYFVDGSPTVGDVYDTTAAKWKTVLVGGLRSGGRGYYALDVTDPSNPIAMWEFNVRALASCPSATVAGDTDDCDLGLTFGNPAITKLADGTWVVVVTSGYNNVGPGDGKGYVYVLNAVTGQIIRKIQAANAVQLLSPGDTTTPSGLSRINVWVDNAEVNNTALRVYSGDLLGNLWRFNLDTGTAYAIAKLTDPSNAPQSVTTVPELAEVDGKPMIYVGTGRYLGASDVNSTQVQTIYGLKDTTNGVVPVTPINARGSTVVAQTLTNSPTVLGTRNVTANPADLTVKDGWRVDLPDPGERVNVDAKLVLGTLIVASNVPAPSVCEPSGSSWLNFLDYRTGGYIPSAGSAFASVNTKGLIVGISVVVTSDGKIVAIVVKDDDTVETSGAPIDTASSGGRRSSWREIR